MNESGINRQSVTGGGRQHRKYDASGDAEAVPVGIYLHIPFCADKCGYCDFLSFAGMEDKWAIYMDALNKEISVFFNSRDPSVYAVDTVYIGGGTPTILPSLMLSRLLGALPPTLPGAEITCEANPGTLTPEKIAALSSGGVNRISLGLQAWQPYLLDAIGRSIMKPPNGSEPFVPNEYSENNGLYVCRTFMENFASLRKAGFNNINIDIMFALPGQSFEDWEETLTNVTALEPEHISAYSLTLEEKSDVPFDEEDEETDRLMYHRCREFLQKRGYVQYELSNFCKPGYESRHNEGYWTRKPYFGFGLGAHSFDGRTRWNNTKYLDQYLRKCLIQQNLHINKMGSEQSETIVTHTEAMSEFMFLGLRMTAGVCPEDFYDKFGMPLREIYGSWITKMENDGLICERLHGGRPYIALTERGMDLANLVMAGFLE